MLLPFDEPLKERLVETAGGVSGCGSGSVGVTGSVGASESSASSGGVLLEVPLELVVPGRATSLDIANCAWVDVLLAMIL